MICELKQTRELRFQSVEWAIGTRPDQEGSVDEFLSSLRKGLDNIKHEWQRTVGEATGLARLAYQISICYFLGIGTEVNEFLGLRWMLISGLGGYAAGVISAPLVRRSCHCGNEFEGPWAIFLAICALARYGPQARALQEEYPIVYRAVMNVIRSRKPKDVNSVTAASFCDTILATFSEADPAQSDNWSLDSALKSNNFEVARELLLCTTDASVAAGSMHCLPWLEDGYAARLAPLLFEKGALLDVVATSSKSYGITLTGTPLSLAVTYHLPKLTLALLKLHIENNIPVVEPYDVFESAVIFHDAETLKWLFDYKSRAPNLFPFLFDGPKELTTPVNEGAAFAPEKSYESAVGMPFEQGNLQSLLQAALNIDGLRVIGRRVVNMARFRSAQAETIDILLKNGADPTFLGQDKEWSPFCQLIRYDDEISLQRFVSHILSYHAEPLAFFAKPLSGGVSTALDMCIRTGARRCFQIMLDSVPESIYFRNELGLTALHTAAQQEDIFYVEKLLESGANAVVYSDAGWPPLFDALLNNIAAADSLANKCSPEVLTKLLGPAERSPPLTMLGGLLARYVMQRTRTILDAVKWVHARGGAYFFSEVPGDMPAWDILLRQRQPRLESHVLLDAELARTLFDMFPKRLEWQKYIGLSPLHLAVLNSNVHAVRALLERGVNVNQKTISSSLKSGEYDQFVGLTAVDMAAAAVKSALSAPEEVRDRGAFEMKIWNERSREIVKLLLANGADSSNTDVSFALEVLALRFPDALAISYTSLSPLPEESMRSSWPVALPHDETSLGDEELDEYRRRGRETQKLNESLPSGLRNRTGMPKGFEDHLERGVKMAELKWRLQDMKERLNERWEARVTTGGRIYYVDHHSRSTTWDRPKF
jgi:ankyrin repeat protein